MSSTMGHTRMLQAKGSSRTTLLLQPMSQARSRSGVERLRMGYAVCYRLVQDQKGCTAACGPPAGPRVRSYQVLPGRPAQGKSLYVRTRPLKTAGQRHDQIDGASE